MSKIYNRNCNNCGKKYRGQGSKYCSKKCSVILNINFLNSNRFGGMKHSIETLKKKSLVQFAEKGSNWQGGLTEINRAIRKRFKYRIWREAVFRRDNYTCQICAARNGNGKYIELQADHIKPFSLFPELRFELSNGRTLCVSCHRKTNTFGHKVHSYAR